MKRSMLFGALLLGASLALQQTSTGHGGTYRGPGDTVPGGGGSGGDSGPPTPRPGQPGGPGPSNPTTPGRGAPGVPGGGGQGTPTSPSTGGLDAGADLTAWQFWWGFNKDPYLNLKARIHMGAATTGGDDWFLGYGQRDRELPSLRPSDATIRDRIVPALVRALESESSNDVVTGALIALAKIGEVRTEAGEAPFRRLIQARLSDPVQEIRETAAVALGILADEGSIPLLAGIALADGDALRLAGIPPAAVRDYRTRAFATYGLGLVGHRAGPEERREIVGILRRLLEARESYSTPDIPVAALIAMGLVPIELLETQAPPNPKELAEWARARVEAPDPAASRWQQVQYLLRFLEDGRIHPAHRAHAPRAIGRLIEGVDPTLRTRAATALLDLVGRNADAEVSLRQSAALAMGQVGRLGEHGTDVRIRAALVEAYSDAHPQVQGFALISLAQIAGRPGLGDGDPQAGYEEIRKFLLRQLSQAKTVKPWVGLALGVMERARLDGGQVPDASVTGALRETLRRENNPSSVGAYAIGAGIAGDLEAGDILLSKLETLRVDEARGDVAVALGLLGDQRARAPLVAIVEASRFRPELLRQSSIALGLLMDKGVVRSLIDMLQEASSLATQAAIASALGFIGDAGSVDPLLDLLEDQEVTGRARAFAAVALGIVADKELLPWNSKISVDINYRASTVSLTGEGGTGILDIL